MAQKPTPQQANQPRRVPLHNQSVRTSDKPHAPHQPQPQTEEPALTESWDDEEPAAAPVPEEPVKVPPPIEVGAGKPLNKVPSKFRKLL